MYKYILFDLDGTLTDPSLGITNSVMYALEKLGIKPPERKELYKFIGPPLHESFMKYYGLTDFEADRAIEYYREYFRPKGIYENSVYNGVVELLEELKKLNKTVILATSKPEEFAREILRHFKLEKYFFFAAGATMDTSRSKKADVIRYALNECGITDTTACVMIGDRMHDISGAKENGLSSIGVLYGYGDYNELKKAKADYIVKEPLEILNYLD